VGQTFITNALAVTEGLFSVRVDFGAGVFDGQDRGLDIALKPTGLTGEPTPLTPRQPVTPAPQSPAR